VQQDIDPRASTDPNIRIARLPSNRDRTESDDVPVIVTDKPVVPSLPSIPKPLRLTPRPMPVVEAPRAAPADEPIIPIELDSDDEEPRGPKTLVTAPPVPEHGPPSVSLEQAEEIAEILVAETDGNTQVTHVHRDEEGAEIDMTIEEQRRAGRAVSSEDGSTASGTIESGLDLHPDDVAEVERRKRRKRVTEGWDE